MRIAFAFNVKKSAPTTGREEDMEFDTPEVIGEVKAAIEANGHGVVEVEADENAFAKLQGLKGEIDLVFNMAEGLRGEARESQVPIFCELLKIPYTHSGPTTMAVKLHKQFCKQVLAAVGVKVPRGQVVRDIGERIRTDIKFPAIVKPNKEGSSKGVFDRSVVENETDLRVQVKELFKMGIDEVLVEDFIDGREFTVALLGNEPRVLPIFEQKFDILPAGMHKIAGFEYKWIYETQMKDVTDGYSCPAEITNRQRQLIEATSVKIFRALEIKDACRIDYRMDGDGELYFIEVNTIPGIIKDPEAPSYYVYSAYKAGMSYEEMIGGIIESARVRWGV